MIVQECITMLVVWFSDYWKELISESVAVVDVVVADVVSFCSAVAQNVDLLDCIIRNWSILAIEEELGWSATVGITSAGN